MKRILAGLMCVMFVLSLCGCTHQREDGEYYMGFKIREAQLEKVPYMLVVGEKEVEANAVSVRSRDKGEMGSLSVDEFVAMVCKEVEDKVNVIQN